MADAAQAPAPAPVKEVKEEKVLGDLYLPRKCSATSRLINAKDHAAVQINIGHLTNAGVFSNQYTTVAVCGFVRANGNGDDALNRLAISKNLMKNIYGFAGAHKFATPKADREDE